MSDLLKSAIADAKAVRATALANAKAALEEAFAPKLQGMLGRQLQQELEDEEVTDTVSVEEPAAELPSDAPGVDLGQNLLAPDSEAGTSEPTAQVGAGSVSGEEEGEMEEYQTLGSGNPDPVEKTTELTEDDSYALDTANKGATTKNVKKADNVAPNKSAEKDKPATTDFKKDAKEISKAKEDYPGDKKGPGAKETTSAVVKDFPKGGTRDVGTPGKNVAPNTSAEKDKPATKDFKAVNEADDIRDEELDEILKELENEVNLANSADTENPSVKQAPQDPSQAQYPGTSCGSATSAGVCEDEEIDLSELLHEGPDTETADDKAAKKEKDAEKEEADKEDAVDKPEGKGKPDWLKENISLKAELTEYRNTVKFLRDRINEVNLLNAKLLYTNKLFKQTGLTNEQKLRVIESFDLTKSVREAKIVYATLAESLSFGATKAKAVAPTKSTAVVKSITEGLASKSVASTKSPKAALLTEGAVMATRFQKLAGIKVK